MLTGKWWEMGRGQKWPFHTLSQAIANDCSLTDLGIGEEASIEVIAKFSKIESFNPLPHDIITLHVGGTTLKTSRHLLCCDKIEGSLFHQLMV